MGAARKRLKKPTKPANPAFLEVDIQMEKLEDAKAAREDSDLSFKDRFLILLDKFHLPFLNQ